MSGVKPAILLAMAGIAQAGPFPPAAGVPGSDAVPRTHPSLAVWADGIHVERGPVDLAVPDGAPANYGLETDALGPADADADLLETFPVVSLGDGGSATLTFPRPIADGPGHDLAVFENSFTDSFLELAFVEVSSDGRHFARFPAVSLTPLAAQVGSFAGIDPTDLHNLAGKHRAGFGTPFDLAEIRDPSVNTAAITHVRIVDVVGSIDPALGRTDSRGVLVNDPYPTPFPSSGFDLDAVGALHPAPAGWGEWSRFYFGIDQAEPLADPDRDGLPNRVEWALWTSPLRADRGCRPEHEDGAFRLRFRYHELRRATAARIEGSGDLRQWTTVASDGPAGWQADAAGIAVSVTAGVPAEITLTAEAGSHRYFRFACAP
jgi:hypothetical protein